MEHSVWIDAGATMPASRVLLAQCGLDPDTTHRGVREALDMWFRGEISRLCKVYEQLKEVEDG